MPTRINYDLLPTHLQAGMRRYIEQGIETGSFLRAALEKDFEDAFLRADPYTRLCMEAVECFLESEIPPDAWGSPAKVQAWIDKHRKAL